MAASEAIWAETDLTVPVEEDDAWLEETRQGWEERLARVYEDPDV